LNYGRFIGFKEQLGFFEFFCELALANHVKIIFLKTNLRPFFTKMCVFWAKHNIFKLAVGDFPTIQIFFCAQKSSNMLQIYHSKVFKCGSNMLQKGATKRISKKVLFQATLMNISHDHTDLLTLEPKFRFWAVRAIYITLSIDGYVTRPQFQDFVISIFRKKNSKFS
jgi:hypothetical protein